MAIETASDLIAAVLKNCGERVDGSSPYHADALDYVNQFHVAFHEGSSLFDLNFGKAWTWAKEPNPQVLNLRPADVTGTCTVTQGSANAAFNTARAESYADWMIQFGDRPETYRIAEHADPFGAMVLDAEYVGDDDADVTFRAFKIDYALDQVEGQKIIRLVAPMLVYADQEDPEADSGLIDGMEESTFKQKWPLKWIREGVPTKFCEVEDNDGAKVVRFNRYPQELTRVEYELVQKPNELQDSDSSVARLPLMGRRAIEYGATFKLMLDTDDDRAQKYLDMAQAQLIALETADRKERAQTSTKRGMLVPRPDLDRPIRRFFR